MTSLVEQLKRTRRTVNRASMQQWCWYLAPDDQELRDVHYLQLFKDGLRPNGEIEPEIRERGLRFCTLDRESVRQFLAKHDDRPDWLCPRAVQRS